MVITMVTVLIPRVKLNLLSPVPACMQFKGAEVQFLKPGGNDLESLVEQSCPRPAAALHHFQQHLRSGAPSSIGVG